VSVFGFGQMDHAPQIDGPSPKDGAALGKTLVHRLLEPLSDGAMGLRPGARQQYPVLSGANLSEGVAGAQAALQDQLHLLHINGIFLRLSLPALQTQHQQLGLQVGVTAHGTQVQQHDLPKGAVVAGQRPALAVAGQQEGLQSRRPHAAAVQFLRGGEAAGEGVRP